MRVESAQLLQDLSSQRLTENDVERGRERQIDEEILADEKDDQRVVVVANDIERDERVVQPTGKVGEEQPDRLAEKSDGDFVGQGHSRAA